MKSHVRRCRRFLLSTWLVGMDNLARCVSWSKRLFVCRNIVRCMQLLPVADRPNSMGPLNSHNKIFREAWQTAIDLDGLQAIDNDGVVKTRYQHWCGRNPKFAKHLPTWGEAGTVNSEDAQQCVFVGCKMNQSDATTCLLHPRCKIRLVFLGYFYCEISNA